MTYSRGTMTRWLRAGECAGPALTAFLQAQAANQQPALQARSGFLVTNPAQLPQVFAVFKAEVCHKPSPEGRATMPYNGGLDNETGARLERDWSEKETVRRAG
jgi:hypothetical protein